MYEDSRICWIKIDQLDVTCFIISLFTAQHVSNVSTSIFRSLWLICGFISWVVLLWFDVCWCYSVVWLGWCGILMQASACIRIPNHTVTPTHIEPEQYNTWNKSTIICKLLNMDVLTFKTYWAVNSEIISKWHQIGLSLFNYQDDSSSNKQKIHSRIYIEPYWL
jgi:hypothetical protein